MKTNNKQPADKVVQLHFLFNQTIAQFVCNRIVVIQRSWLVENGTLASPLIIILFPMPCAMGKDTAIYVHSFQLNG